MHLLVCVWSLLRGVVFGEMDQPAGFFMLRFYFKTILTLLLSNLFWSFSFAYNNFSLFWMDLNNQTE